MGDVKEFDVNAVLCSVCRKRKAIVLCDAIIGNMRYAGHPPKVNGVFSNEPMESAITCDKPMCSRCTTKVTEHMDLCPEHARPLINRKDDVK